MTPFDIWTAGIPLPIALISSPDGQLWARDDANVRAAYDRLRTEPRSPLYDRAASLVAIQTLASESEALEARLEGLRSALLRRLVGGEVCALGFSGVRVSGCQELSVLAPATWRDEQSINWEASTLAHGSFVIRDVRIATSAMPALRLESEIVGRRRPST